MKISNSKKELARIISENGGWRDGEFAAQDKISARIDFYKEKPWINGGQRNWNGDYIVKRKMYATEVIHNWHQTILSREEYFHLYPAPDADGWIEWGGGECPVDVGTIVDVKQRGGDFGTYLHAGRKTFEPQSEGMATAEDWSHLDGDGDIIAYRLHKPTIEQLASDYRNAKDYAERKQKEADDAKADSDARLKALEIAGEAIGLLVSPITDKQEPELVITDWQDLRVGDVVWYGGDDGLSPGEYHVMEIEAQDYEGYRTVLVNDGDGGHWIDTRAGWGFIRRP